MASLWFIGDNRYNECYTIPNDDAKGPYHPYEDERYSREQLTICEWSKSKTVLAVTTGWEAIYAIYTVKCERNELLCCGFIRESQREFPFKNKPFYIISDEVSALCLLYLEHLKQYWAAGNNKSGQCGVENLLKGFGECGEEQLPLSRIEGLDSLENVLKVKSGPFGASTLWIKYDGSLYLNGSNKYGQIPTSSPTSGVRVDRADVVFTPTLSSFTQSNPELRCVDGASTYGINVIVTDNGSAWFAGEFASESKGAFTPLDVPSDYHIVSVSAGFAHILFLTKNGSVLGFGNNGLGQLGLGEEADDEYLNLQLISFFEENNVKIQSVCCGKNHNLALSVDGTVYVWGANEMGKCGVADGENRSEMGTDDAETVWTPEPIDIVLEAAVKHIECGFMHSGLLTVDNEVYLWGCNDANECCANSEKEEKAIVWSPQNVTDYVLSRSHKDKITNFYLGCLTTMFLLE